MNNQQITLPNNTLLPSIVEVKIYETIAQRCVQSGLYPHIKNETQAMAIILMARELGISPMIALNKGIIPIKGGLEISARMMSALIRRAGHSIIVKELINQRCIIEGKRKDSKDCFTATYTIEDAKKANLVTTGSAWEKYPADMLYARALTRIARQLFADVIGTAYIEGEISDPQGLENVPEADLEVKISIEEIKLKEQQEIEEFIENWNGDKKEIEGFIDFVNNIYKSKTKHQVIEMLKKDANYTSSRFDAWKLEKENQGK